MFANLSRGLEPRPSTALRRESSEDQEKEETTGPGLRHKISRSLQRSRVYNTASMERNAGRHFADLFRSESDSSAASGSPPPQKPPPSTPPPLTPPEKEAEEGIINDGFVKMTIPVFEEPRKAPTPPKRPPRPSSELFLPGSPPKPADPPPPIPQKSSLRRSNVTRQDHFSELRPLPLFTDNDNSPKGKGSPSLRSSSSRSSLESQRAQGPHQRKDSDVIPPTGLQRRASKHRRDSASSTSSFTSRIGNLARATTAPGALFTLEGKSERSLSASNAGSSTPNRISHDKKRLTSRSLDSHLTNAPDRKKASQRLDIAADIRARLLYFENSKRGSKNSSDAIAKPVKVAGPDGVQTKMRKKKKGETMSMLLEDGFFPVEEFVYNESTNAPRRPTSKDFRITLPPRLSFIDRSLPSTPGSAQSTPTEMYNRSPTSPRTKSSYRRSTGAPRRPLSQISENEVNEMSLDSALGTRKESAEPLSGSRLEAIPEDAAASENTPPASASGTTTPVATQIHLRGGSVVTVTPPELTAWKPTVYIYGPIMLPKPAIMPRKNSVASLDPFQEVVDKLYQDALIIPRRRSDDAVVDDICDFFDEFGFDYITFEGDKLSIMNFDLNELPEMSPDLERFSTPPTELPAASPVEIEVAKEMVEQTTKRLSGSNPPMIEIIAPPVDNEETLRARGIARLSRSSAGSSIEILAGRKESLTLGMGRRSSAGGGLPLLPPPEESMLEAVLQPARTSMDGASFASNMHSSKSGRDGRSHSASSRSSWRGQGSGIASVRSGSQAAVDGDEGVAEIEEGSSWTAGPQIAGVSKNMTPKKSRNPVRRLVATASTIL